MLITKIWLVTGEVGEAFTLYDAYHYLWWSVCYDLIMICSKMIATVPPRPRSTSRYEQKLDQLFALTREEVSMCSHWMAHQCLNIRCNTVVQGVPPKLRLDDVPDGKRCNSVRYEPILKNRVTLHSAINLS